jgi:hypothetical protein
MRTIALTLSLVLVFMIPWEGVIKVPALGTEGSSSAARFMGLAVGTFWVATVVMTRRFRRPRPFHVMVFLFVLWNVLSVLWSGDPNSTIDHVVTWGQSLGMVFILWDLYTTRAALLAGLQAYILGAYVALGGAVASYFAGNTAYKYQRFTPGGDVNPDGFAFIVALGIPVACIGCSRCWWPCRCSYWHITSPFFGAAM